MGTTTDKTKGTPMIEVQGKELLELANKLLQLESWAKPHMVLTLVEQKGSALVFYGTGFSSEDSSAHLDLLNKLDAFSLLLEKKYTLAE